jgi:transposase
MDEEAPWMVSHENPMTRKRFHEMCLHAPKNRSCPVLARPGGEPIVDAFGVSAVRGKLKYAAESTASKVTHVPAACLGAFADKLGP